MKIWRTVTFTAFSALALAACSNEPSPGETPVSDPATENNSSVVESSTTDQAMADVISMDQALDVFWQEYPDAQIKEVDFDEDWGEWTYQITGIFEDREYEVEINATTSTVEKVEDDRLDDDDRDVLTLDGLITPDEAVSIARQEVEADATLEGWNLSFDDDRMQAEYEVEFKGSDDRDVTIHAETGEVLEVER